MGPGKSGGENRPGAGSKAGMSATPLVSVIVLNYNGQHFLKACFDSLLGSGYPELELLLVDNASTDDSLAFMRQHYPTVSLLETGSNLGYSGGYNFAVPRANGRYAVLLNADVEVTPGWLQPLVAELEANGQVAACQPKFRHLINRDEFEYAGASGGFIDRYGFPFLRGRVLNTIETDSGQYDDRIDLFWASGAGLMVRVTDYASAGGLDADFFLHMEEIDLCWRWHLTGHTVRVVPQSIIYHLAGGIIKSDSYMKMYYNHRNSIFMLWKNYSAGNLVRVLPVRMALDLVLTLKSLVTLDFKRLLAVPMAYLWLLGHLPMLWRKRRRVQAMRTVTDGEIAPLMLPGSLVIDYYLRGKKTFSQLWRGTQ